MTKRRSLNNPQCDRAEYLERRVAYYRSFDINISHANIVLSDFGTSVHRFMSEPITVIVRKYLYLQRGKYGNNVRV